MRYVIWAAMTLTLAACNAGSGDQEASERAVEEAGGPAYSGQHNPADRPGGQDKPKPNPDNPAAPTP